MPDQQANGRIVAFYSYKGGTGRTMLLANVAWVLASRGKKVLMIDWDLEAPGLHHYFHPFLRDRELRQTDGLIDLVVEHATRVVSPATNPESQEKGAGTGEPVKAPDSHLIADSVDPLNYVVGLEWPFMNGGLLHLMPAGQQDASYSVRVNSFDWRDYYERLGGGAFFEKIRGTLKSVYDYVLIDSRTGVSDTSGICTVQMPDRLVVCFALSEANVAGGAATAAFVRSKWEAKGRKGIANDIFPVVTRIDLGEKEKLNAALAHVRELFKPVLAELTPERLEDRLNKAQVLYLPYYAFEEILAVFGDRSATPGSLLASSVAIANMISDGEVSEVTLPSEFERARVLDIYERKSRETPPAAEWIVGSDWQEVVNLAEALRREYGLRTTIIQREEWAASSRHSASMRTPIILTVGRSGGRDISEQLWAKLERQVEPKGGRKLFVLILKSAEGELALPDFAKTSGKIDLRDGSDNTDAVIRLRYSIVGGEIIASDDQRVVDLRMERRLRESAAIWNDRNRDEDFLLRGVALHDVNDFLQHSSINLTGVVSEFVEASRSRLEQASKIEQLNEKIIASEARQANLRRATIAAAMLAAIMVIGVLFWINDTLKQATEQVEKARERFTSEVSLRDMQISRLQKGKDDSDKSAADRGKKLEELRQEQEERTAEVEKLKQESELKTLEQQQRVVTYLIGRATDALNDRKPLLATQLVLQAVAQSAEGSVRSANEPARRLRFSDEPLRLLREILALTGGRPLARRQNRKGSLDRISDLSLNQSGSNLIAVWSTGYTAWDTNSFQTTSGSDFEDYLSIRPKIALSADATTAVIWNTIDAAQILNVSSGVPRALKAALPPPPPKTRADSKSNRPTPVPIPDLTEKPVAAFFIDDQIVSVSALGAVQLVDPSTLTTKPLRQLKGWQSFGSPEALRFRLPYPISLVRRTLAAISQDNLAIWDVFADRAPIRMRVKDLDKESSVSISANGQYVVVSADRRRSIFDVANRSSSEIFSGFGISRRELLAINATGKYIAAAVDSTIFIWGVDEQAIVAQLHGHDSEIMALVFSPSGRQMFTASTDGSVRAWDIPGDFRTSARPPQAVRSDKATGGSELRATKPVPIETASAEMERKSAQELIDLAQQVLGENMDCATWRRFFPMDPYRANFQNLPSPNCDARP